MYYGKWDVSLVGEFDPTEWFGFVYEVVQKSTGKSYIGRKQFKFKRKKTKANKSRTKDSDWKDYNTSSELVQSLIEETGVEDFEFKILKLCSGKCELNYEEESLQREKDVLRARLPDGSLRYLNRTIGYKNFGGLEKQTEESKAKISAALTGRTTRPRTDDEKARISAAQKGIPNPFRHKLTDENRAIAASGPNKLPWWHNGTMTKRSTECPGEGWIEGMGHSTGTHKNHFWWNNGTENRRCSECPGEGWSSGRVRQKSAK